MTDPRPAHQARLDVLYPRPAECPHCWLNLRRHRLTMGIAAETFIDSCPECKGELMGF